MPRTTAYNPKRTSAILREIYNSQANNRDGRGVLMDLFRTSGEIIARLVVTAPIFPLAVFGQEPTAEFIEQTAARTMETFNTPGMAITRMMRRNAHGKPPATAVMPDEQAIFDVKSETSTRLRDTR